MTKKVNTATAKTEFTLLEKLLVGIAISFALFGLLIFISTIFLFNHGEAYSSSNKINSDKFGDFGSFISGAVGALWTLVSVILFYITLRLQRKELALQREELELTRNELRGQKNELEKANVFSAIQQFDNKFFQLIGLQNEIRNGIYIDKTSNSFFNMENESGIQFFQTLSLLMSNLFYRTHKGDNVFGKDPNEEKLIRIYKKAYHQYKAILGHYFRNLFHIVRIVDENQLLDENQKKDYLKILRAQLSQYELVLLAYNALTNYGEKFYPLINKYELLKNIDFELLTPANYTKKIISPEILTLRYEHLKPVYEEQKRMFENDNTM